MAEVSKPEPGEHGGALAVLTKDQNGDYSISSEFFRNHNAQTQYEIGSVTKTMVSYLLAVLAQDGTVNENMAVNEYIQEADASLTLTDLATHHSGLPRLPVTLFEGADPHDPYAHFDSKKLREALTKTELGEKEYLYSNYGYGLLGEVLAQAAGTDLSGLMELRLFEPAGMVDSYMSLSGKLTNEHLVQGHDSLGNPAGVWHFQALSGAGSVVSTLGDMVNYTRFILEGLNTGNPAITNMLEGRHEIFACCQQALGWIIQEDEQGRAFAWHAGQTAGFTAYVGFYLDGSAALVFLNSQSVDHSSTMQRRLWKSVP